MILVFMLALKCHWHIGLKSECQDLALSGPKMFPGPVMHLGLVGSARLHFWPTVPEELHIRWRLALQIWTTPYPAPFSSIIPLHWCRFTLHADCSTQPENSHLTFPDVLWRLLHIQKEAKPNVTYAIYLSQVCFAFPLQSTTPALYERSCGDAAQHGDSWSAGPEWPHTAWWKQLVVSQGSLMMSFPRGKMPSFRVVDPSGIAEDKLHFCCGCWMFLWLQRLWDEQGGGIWATSECVGQKISTKSAFLVSFCFAFSCLAVWIFLWYHLRWMTTEWCVIILKCRNVYDFSYEMLHERSANVMNFSFSS